MKVEVDILMLLDNPFVSDLRVEKEARSLTEAGYRVTVLCEQSADLPESEIRHGFNVVRMLDSFFKHPLRAGYERKSEELIENISARYSFRALHCHDVYMLLIGAKMKTANPSIHLIYDAHEYYRAWPLYKDIPNLKGRIKGWLVWRYLIAREKKCCTFTDAVVCPTSSLAALAKKDLNLIHEPITLRNVPEMCGDLNLIDLKKQLGIPHNHFLMVQSGSIYQNLTQLEATLEAVLQLPNLHWVLIGSNAKFHLMKAHFSDRVQTQGRLHFVAYDQEQLYSMLRSCDFGYLYVQTDRYQAHYLGSPNRIMEYGFCDLPYVSVHHALSKELNEKFNHVVFYSIHDYKELAEKLNYMIANLVDKKLNAASFSQSFSWKIEFSALLSFYQRVIPVPKNLPNQENF